MIIYTDGDTTTIRILHTLTLQFSAAISETDIRLSLIHISDGSSYEANCATHGAPLGGDAYVNTIKNLNGDPANPFVIFPEVAEL